jgi:fibronectin-binding autotransporter adhesin
MLAASRRRLGRGRDSRLWHRQPPRLDTPGGTDPTCASPCASVQGAVNRAAGDLQSGAASSALPRWHLGNALQGGGLNNAGDLTLLRDTVAFNTASDPPSGHSPGTGSGGGIFNSGSLTVQDSTVSSNRAAASGGGIGMFGGTLNAARDAIVNNSAGPDLGAGGGVAVSVDSYCCSVTDSTIAGNVTEGSATAAGVFVSLGGLRLYGDTIAGNRAATGVGGIESYFATLDIGGTLLAQNPQDCSNNGGAIIPHGGDLADDASCPAELSGVDPKLQPLANNGGPSQTMAIAASSPAYDANTLCAGTDQRAVSRMQLGASRCDIGAYRTATPLRRPRSRDL